jgi:hypothetical protein
MATRAYQRRALAQLSSAPDFRDEVEHLRRWFNTGPDDRRAAEEHLRGRIRKRVLSDVAVGQCELAVASSVGGLDVVFMALDKSAKLLFATEGPGEVLGIRILRAAVWTDFEGPEFNLFCALAVPVVALWWMPELGTLDGWRAWAFQPNRVYLDVTEAEIDDIRDWWDVVRAAKKRMGVHVAKRGLPKGTVRTRPKVLRGLDWEQLRAKVEADPNCVNRFEAEYVAAFAKRRVETLGRRAERREEAHFRRLALDNYRKQVRAPLGLRSARGRRRLRN